MDDPFFITDNSPFRNRKGNQSLSAEGDENLWATRLLSLTEFSSRYVGQGHPMQWLPRFPDSRTHRIYIGTQPFR